MFDKNLDPIHLGLQVHVKIYAGVDIKNYSHKTYFSVKIPMLKCISKFPIKSIIGPLIQN